MTSFKFLCLFVAATTLGCVQEAAFDAGTSPDAGPDRRIELPISDAGAGAGDRDAGQQNDPADADSGVLNTIDAGQGTTADAGPMGIEDAGSQIPDSGMNTDARGPDEPVDYSTSNTAQCIAALQYVTEIYDDCGQDDFALECSVYENDFEEFDCSTFFESFYQVECTQDGILVYGPDFLTGTCVD